MRAFRGTHLFSTKSVEKCGKSLLGSWGAGWKMRLSAAGGPHGGSQGEGGRENVYLAPILLGETKRCSTVGEGLRRESQRLL